MSTSPPSPHWSRDTKFLVTVIALLVAVGLVYLARSVVPTLALAAVLAYILQPLVGWLERHRVSRGLAALLCLLMLVLLVALGPVLLVPAIVGGVRSIADVLTQLPALLQQIRDQIVDNAVAINVLGRAVDVKQIVLTYEDEIQQTISELRMPAVTDMVNYFLEGVRTAGGVFRTAAGIASSVLAVVFSSFLLLVYTFYLTKDGNQLRAALNQWTLPTYRTEMQELARRLDAVWKSFFRGQIVLSLTVGIVTTIVLSVLGVQGAFVLGLLAGILEVVPNLGPILAMIPAVLVALIQGPSYLPVSNLLFAGIVVLVYVVIQQVENNVLVPRIMGMSLNLHPLIVLIGVVVGAGFAGILGAFLAAPVLASLKVLATYAVAKITDQEPFAAPEPRPPIAKKPGKLKQGLAWLKAKHGRDRSDIPAPDSAQELGQDVAIAAAVVADTPPHDTEPS